MKPTFINWKKPQDLTGLCTAVSHHRGKWSLVILPSSKGDSQDCYVWDAVILKCSAILGIKSLSSSANGGIIFFKNEEQLNRILKIFNTQTVKSSGIIARKYNPKCELVAEN